MREQLIAVIKGAQETPKTNFKLINLEHYQSQAIYFGSRVDSEKVKYVEATGNKAVLLSVEEAVELFLKEAP